VIEFARLDPSRTLLEKVSKDRGVKLLPVLSKRDIELAEGSNLRRP
jgi:hypothetical protein